MSNVLDELVEGFEPSPQLVSVMASSKAAVLLALDIGTSGVRAALFDEHGSEIKGASIRISRWNVGVSGFATIDPDALVEEVAQAIDALFEKLYDPEIHIQFIAVSCFWHSLVGVDPRGTPTTTVFGWADRSAAGAAYELRSQFDEHVIHARTGCRFHPSYWPAKLLRLRNEEPDIFRLTTRWLSFADYLSLRLCGAAPTSVSMASGSGLLNQHTCEWDLELVEALRINAETLPAIAETDETIDRIADTYRNRWPQLSDARFYPAIGDGAANNIGAACCSKEKMALMVGTSGAMRIILNDSPPPELPPELWCYRVDRNRVIVGGALSDGGGLHNWIKESMLVDYDLATIENRLARLAPDEHNLTILPFFTGERSTGWHPNAFGSIVGLTLETAPIEILRAAMEAIAYRFALIARALDPFAHNVAIAASGHALRCSPTWVQILADVLGKPLAISDLPEASTRGAALLALEAAGKIRSIDEFTVPVQQTYQPDMSRHELYQKGLERQEALYKKVFAEN
jgi:gluconokinase